MPTYPYTNYEQYMDPARKRYFQMITGGLPPSEFVSGQVAGTAAGIEPYIRQAGSQYAANLGARGGAGAGAGSAYLSGLTGQKIGALAQTRAGAQRSLYDIGAQATGFGQREAFQLSEDQIRKFMAGLEERRVKLSEEQLRMLKAQFPWMFAGDVLGAGAQAAGYAMGGG